MYNICAQELPFKTCSAIRADWTINWVMARSWIRCIRGEFMSYLIKLFIGAFHYTTENQCILHSRLLVRTYQKIKCINFESKLQGNFLAFCKRAIAGKIQFYLY